MFSLKILLAHLNPLLRLVSVDRTFSVYRGYIATTSSDLVIGRKRVIRHNGVKYTYRRAGR
jgi:hypothetical protein